MTRLFHQSSLMRRLLIGVAMAFLMQNMAWSTMNVTSQSEDGTWIVICTTQGFKRVLIEDLYDDDGLGTNFSANSCDLCVFASGLGFGYSNNVDLNPKLGVISKVNYTSHIKYGKQYYSNYSPRSPPLV